MQPWRHLAKSLHTVEIGKSPKLNGCPFSWKCVSTNRAFNSLPIHSQNPMFAASAGLPIYASVIVNMLPVCN